MMKPGCAMLTMSRIPNEIEIADRHRRIERAEQQARDQRVDEQVVWNVHHSPRMATQDA